MAANFAICFFSLKEFLPLGFMKVRNVEKKIFGEHKSLMGTSEIDSKYKYVKLARGLPTFGVHFFLVKVREHFTDNTITYSRLQYSAMHYNIRSTK